MTTPHPAEALVANGKSRALTTWEGFQAELRHHEHEIATMLPRHVSRERFMSSAVAAVKQNPNLLKVKPRSLFQAITQSAQDGLLPDGREGVITAYKDEAKWNPMTHGLRKRARELDHLVIDCQVVYANDHFIWHQGDEPRLEHIPAPLGTNRGGMIGAYAIFKSEQGILHREVMDVNEIAAVRSQSKQPDGLLWTKFASEGWKKTVLRRGIKSVPCGESLARIVERDNDLYQFEPNGTKIVEAPSPPKSSGPEKEGSPVSAAQPERATTPEPSTRRKKGEPRTDATPYAKQEIEEAEIVAAEPFTDRELHDYIEDLGARYEQADSRADIEEIKADCEENGYPRMLPMDKSHAERLYNRALERLNG